MSGQDQLRDLSPGETGSFCLGLLVVVLLLCSACPPPISARTWYIKADGTGDAPTIQAGVDSAAAGDTVMVGGGTYTDTTHVMVAGTSRAVNVHVQKQTTILGDPSGDRPFIDGVQSYVGIFVEAPGSVISIGHLQLKGTAFLQPIKVDRHQQRSEIEPVEYPARIRCYSSSVELQDLIISNDNYGVFLWNSVGTISDSELHTLTSGIFAYEGSNTTVRGSCIFDGPIGVECDHSSANIADNTFGAPPPAGQTVSIYCKDSSVDVRGNIVSWSGGLSAIRSEVIFDENVLSNTSGTFVYLGSSSAVVRNNTFYNGGYAVYSVSATTGEISNNTIDKCDVGILSELGPSQLIRNNIISRGGWGIQCVNSALTIDCNDIFDMDTGPYDIELCSEQPGESNFFADPEYCGTDDSGNYYLQSDSPCAPGNHPDGHDCGLIGALPVNCGKVAVEKKTWGGIKTLYKNE